jgi:hypothetical protein
MISMASTLSKPALQYIQSQIGSDMKSLLETLYLKGPKTNESLKKGELSLLRQLSYYKLISITLLEKNYESSLIGDWKPYDRVEYKLNDDGIALVAAIFNPKSN